MPSPFPGMNPYLEQPSVWADFHKSFLITLRTAIVPLVVPRYYAKVEEHVYVRDASDPDDGGGLYLADVAVREQTAGPPPGSGGAAAVAARPTTVRLPAPRGKKRVPYLAVVDRDRNRVVTVVELLSPANKAAGHDREVFLQKRKRLTRSAASYVELDLLRGGRRLPVYDLPACDYYALVSRPAARPAAEVWTVRLRDRLPTVPLPLRSGEPEPTVDLQAVLNQVYDAAGYEYAIYSGRPDPPLTGADAGWAAGLVPAGTGPGDRL